MHKNVSSVSIVIASYNSAEYLPATLESCFNQTVAAKEVILIDDGSTDATETVCSAYTDRIRYVRIANGGVSAARNHGAELASGDWILFLDSDDILLPNALENLLTAAEKQSCGIVYGMVIQRLENPLEPRISGFAYCVGEPPLPAQRNFRRSAIITPGSALVKRSLHQQVGGFVPGYEPMEDRDLWTKCGLYEAIAFCDTVVLDKTWREGSAGSQNAKRIYRGLQAQRDLRTWGSSRQVDLSWVEPDTHLTRDALAEAVYWRTDDILPALLEQSRAVGYRGLGYYRAQLRLLFLHLTGRKPSTPAWTTVKPCLP